MPSIKNYLKRLDSLFEQWNRSDIKKVWTGTKLTENTLNKSLKRTKKNKKILEPDPNIHVYLFYRPEGTDDGSDYEIVETRVKMKLGPNDLEL